MKKESKQYVAYRVWQITQDAGIETSPGENWKIAEDAIKDRKLSDNELYSFVMEKLAGRLNGN